MIKSRYYRVAQTRGSAFASSFATRWVIELIELRERWIFACDLSLHPRESRNRVFSIFFFFFSLSVVSVIALVSATELRGP